MKRNSKKLLAGLLTLGLVLGASEPIEAHAAPDKAEVYRAYFDFLYPESTRLGVIPDNGAYFRNIQAASGQEERTARTTSGILFADLIDFDLDGQEELLYLRMDRSEAGVMELLGGVYGYADGHIVLLYDLSTELDYEWEYATFQLHLTRGSDGRTRISSFQNGPKLDQLIFSSLVAGQWQTTDEFHTFFTPDMEISGPIIGDIMTDTGTFTYFIGPASGGTQVSESQYKAAIGQLTSQLDVIYADKNMTGGPSGIELLHTELPSGTANKTLKALEPYGSNSVKLHYAPPAAWAAGAVRDGTAKGLVPPVLQHSYRQPITRAEFCALATAFYEKYTGVIVVPKQSFTDTDDENVRKMATVGVVNGVGGGKFDPDGKLTREQAATMLSNLSTAIDNPMAAAAPTFADNNVISDWAWDAVGAVKASGIMNGVGANQFAPKAVYTREQSIVTIMNMEQRLVPVTGVTIDLDNASVREGQTIQLKASVIPDNATNKQLTWEPVWESALDYISVDSKGLVKGLKKGAQSVSVTTSNGKTASCRVTVQDGNFIGVQGRDLPVTLNCLAFPAQPGADKGIGYLPADPVVAGTITVDAVRQTVNTNAYHDGSYGVEVFYTTASKVESLQKQFFPYIKWIARDADGVQIDSGLSSAPQSYAAGTKDHFLIHVHGVKPGQAITIDFINDEGREIQTSSGSEPVVELSGFPVTVWEKGLRTTMKSARFYYEYREKEDLYYGGVEFSGTSNKREMTPDFYWRLTDSSGAQTAQGKVYAEAYTHYVGDSGDFVIAPGFPGVGTSGIKMKPGEHYTLEVRSQKF